MSVLGWILDNIIKNINKFITTCYSKYYNKIIIKHTFQFPEFLGIYIIIKITKIIELLKLSKWFWCICYLK